MSWPQPTPFAHRAPHPGALTGPHPGAPTGPPHGFSPGQPSGPVPPSPTRRPAVRTWLIVGLGLIGALGLALLLAIYFGLAFGLVATIAGLLFAIVPLFVLLPFFVWLDRLEAEPWRYLIAAFLYGALVSTIFAAITNTVGQSWLAGRLDPQSADLLTPVVIAPLSEETFKGLFLLLIWAVRRRHLNGIVDGIVYGGIVGAGFAFVENIQYLALALTQTGPGGLLVTFVLRGVLSPFNHSVFTAMTGIGVGIAALTTSRSVRVVAPVLGWLGAVLLHGLWNLGASSGLAGVGISFTLGFFCFLAFIGVALWARRRESRIIADFLRPYLDAGWFHPGEVQMLTSSARRRQARSWSRRSTGRAGLVGMQGFQDSASELALLRARMHRHAATSEELQRERGLLQAVTAHRQGFAPGMMR